MDATNRPSQQLINAQKELARRRRAAGISYPVRDLESKAASTIQCAIPSSQFPVPSSPSAEGEHSLPIPNSALRTPHSELPIRISPTLAAHCLDKNHRHQDAALDGPYRLYKILQALDEHGRGWLANIQVEPLLTKKESPFYIYGRRQLKIILRRGEDLFWQRVKSKGQLRIRLVSRAKVAEALGCGRLQGREVKIPLSLLLGSGRGRQADANAAIYAAVHAGRLRPDKSPSGISKPRPISRASLQDLAGCSRYRQRSYERRMHITVQRNIHILGEYNKYDIERARQHLHLPAYKHTDYLGKVNRHRRGAAYIAVRLPNSYQVPDNITVVNSQRQRTINRLLDGLCHMGSGGSGREKIARRYHSDVATAVRAAQQDQNTPAYWPMKQDSGTRLWQTFGQGCRSQVTDDGSIPHLEFHIPQSENGGDLD